MEALPAWTQRLPPRVGRVYVFRGEIFHGKDSDFLSIMANYLADSARGRLVSPAIAQRDCEFRVLVRNCGNCESQSTLNCADTGRLGGLALSKNRKSHPDECCGNRYDPSCSHAFTVPVSWPPS